MREIKFRAWDKEIDMWQHFSVPDEMIGPQYTEDWDKSTLGQYTGQKTSKAPYVEVYEHDIVERFEGDDLLEIVFEDGAFCFKDSHGETFPLTKIDYVRGNRYENPELLAPPQLAKGEA